MIDWAEGIVEARAALKRAEDLLTLGLIEEGADELWKVQDVLSDTQWCLANQNTAEWARPGDKEI